MDQCFKHASIIYGVILLLIIGICQAGMTQQVSDFSLENTDNELVSLGELKGDKLTVIDFWATWCKPCTKAMPKLNQLYIDYKDQGLNMIGISCDGPRSISKVNMVSQSMRIKYPILKDIDCEVMNAYQFEAFPTLIILDADQNIVYVHEGFVSGDEQKIEEEIVAFLK